MARRVASSASEDEAEGSGSQSQSQPAKHANRQANGNGVKVKAEKVKKEKISRKARVETEEEDEGEEADDHDQPDGVNDNEEDEDENEEGSPKGRKRARIDEDGEAHSVKNERQTRARVQTLPRGEDGFVPGSIVRIQLRNFVTYDWVEFRPGPYLNMILGPNGTGKSSIACAICLGLNWPPSILGRASELNSFVKLGAEDGHIEIELKGPAGKPNLVVKRNLTAKSKGSSFTLNGSSATGTEIKAKMAELNVQVGNLCSFLPQDKVSEFAQMSSQQLLKETQRAAGDENLSAWHQTLIESGKELKGLQDLLAGERDKLKTMQERNDDLEREVERFHQRREIEQRIEDIELLIPIQEMKESKVLYYETKGKQRGLHEVVTALKDKNAPAHALLETYGKKHAQLTKAREESKKKTAATFKRMTTKWADSDRLDKEVEEVSDELDKQKDSEKRRQARMRTFERNIAQMQHTLDNPPELDDPAAINEELKKVTAERNVINARREDLQGRLRDHIDDSAKQNAQLDACNVALRKLADVGERKLENLKRWDKDTYDAVMWLRQAENREKFKAPIIEPPCLCLSVTDKRFTNAIEACFNANQLKMFVAQNQEDYDTLNRFLNDSEGQVLRKGARVNTWFRQKGPIAGPPMIPEEMAQLGFQGYAIQYVDCPEGLMWFLQRDLNLHRTAIGLEGNKVPVGQAMQAVSRFGPNNEGGGANFVAGSTLNMVQRSRYGKKVPQNMTRDVRAARNLAESAIDATEKKKIDDRIKEAKVALSVIEQETTNLEEAMTESNRETADIKKSYDAVNERKKALATAQAKLKSLQHKIDGEQKKLNEARNEPSTDAKSAQLRQEILKLTKQRLKITKQYTELMRSLIRDQAENTRIALEYVQVGANKAALDALCKEKDEEFQKALAEFNEAHTIFMEAKAASKKAIEISKEAIANASEEQRERYKAMEAAGTASDRKAEQLKEDLDTEKNNLEMNRGANPGVIAQYEKRKQEIEALNATVIGRENKIERIERAIKNARDNWEPALEKLVASIGKKFSAAFDRIGCAGEIRISRQEDFDKWAIDILVKFRETERLQLLTAQRQSGGERSLTTILYLMSLTEQARSPFSLVDEINQGMDMRAERAVHDSMVDVTCTSDSAQYFLITPKLLPDLKYHERMKVLCVNNGEWLPEEKHIGNMMGMVEACTQRRNRSANAA